MRSLVLALAMAAAAVSAQAQSDPPPQTLYLHARLIDGTGSKPEPDMAVWVEGELIKAVGPSARLQADAPAAVKRVDVEGRYLLPGLINSHEHFSVPPTRKAQEAQMRRELYSGVTAARDMGGDMRIVANLARAARLGEIPGPDIYYAAFMAGPEMFDDERMVQMAEGERPGQVPWSQAITSQTDLRTAVAMARGTGATGLKVYADLDRPLFDAIVAEAHRQGLPVWAHAMVFPTTPAEEIAAGVETMSHSCMLAYEASASKPTRYHNRPAVEAVRFEKGDAPAVERDLKEMKRKGVILDATDYVYVLIERLRTYFGGDGGPSTYCASELAERITRYAHLNGVEISVGTDGFAPKDDSYSATQTEMEILVDKVGMTPLEAIRSATLVGARAMGKEGTMGTIAPGKLANLVEVSEDPSRDIRALRKIVLVVKRGVAYPRAGYVPLQPEETNWIFLD